MARAVRAIGLGHHTFHRDIGLVHRAIRTLSEPARMLAEMIGCAYGGGRGHDTEPDDR